MRKVLGCGLALALAACSGGAKPAATATSAAPTTANVTVPAAAATTVIAPAAATTTTALATTTVPPTTTTTINATTPVHLQDLLPDIDALWPTEFGPLPEPHETGMLAANDNDPEDVSAERAMSVYRWRGKSTPAISVQALEGAPDLMDRVEADFRKEIADARAKESARELKLTGDWSGYIAAGDSPAGAVLRRYGNRLFQLTVGAKAPIDVSVVERVLGQAVVAIDAKIASRLKNADQPSMGEAELATRAGPDDLLVRFDDFARIIDTDFANISSDYLSTSELSDRAKLVGATSSGTRLFKTTDNRRTDRAVVGVVVFPTPAAAVAAANVYSKLEDGIAVRDLKSLGGINFVTEKITPTSCNVLDFPSGSFCTGVLTIRATKDILNNLGGVSFRAGETAEQQFEYAMFVSGSRLYYVYYQNAQIFTDRHYVEDLLKAQTDRLREVGLLT
jgi:hypothetical protein